MSTAPEYKEYAAYVSTMKNPFQAAGFLDINPPTGKVNSEVSLGMKNLDRIAELELAVKKATDVLVAGDLLCELTAVQILDEVMRVR